MELRDLQLKRLIQMKYTLLTSFISIYEMEQNQEKIKRVEKLIAITNKN